MNNLTIIAPPAKHPEIGVVYDFDDILWPFAKRVSRLTGFPIEQWTEFDIDQNPVMTREQRDLIYELFSDPAVFRNIEFYPEVGEIVKLLELGVRPKIVSNSCHPDIAVLKVEQLMTAVPELRESDMIMRVVTRGSSEALGKTVPENTVVLVDDSPYNFQASPARYNVLMRKPWNTTVKACKLIGNTLPTKATGTKFFWENGLGAVNARVYHSVQQHLALLVHGSV